MLSNTLQWIDQVNYIIKKANTRLYFLASLKRAKVPPDNVLKFCCTCMKPILEYCAPLFRNAFQNERFQFISPGSPIIWRFRTLIPWQTNVRNYVINFSSPLFPIQTTSYFRSCHPNTIRVTTWEENAALIALLYEQIDYVTPIYHQCLINKLNTNVCDCGCNCICICFVIANSIFLSMPLGN